MSFDKFRKYLVLVLATLVVMFFASSCGVAKKAVNSDKLDKNLDHSFKDYEEVMAPRIPQISDEEKIPSIPEVSQIIATPKPNKPSQDKLVSISVTEDVPVKDVLIELGRLADVDMEIDPKIAGGIILRVKDKPFSQVIERVVDLSGLRYSYKDDILRVERDTPYAHNYPVDFLNIVRSNTGSVNLSTQVLAGSSTSGAGGVNATAGGGASAQSASSSNFSSGSTNQITSSYDGDLWSSVEDAIRNIIEIEDGDLSSSGDSFLSPDGISVNAINPSASRSSGTSLRMNRQAGVISVFATQKQHKNVVKYLDYVKRSVSSQVLIEAKIVEVTLDEQYRTGVNWGTLADTSINVAVAGNFNGGISTTSDFFTISGFGDNALNSAISFTERFGITKTLSSPRILAMNNQQAVLTFAENRVYFTLQVEEEVTDPNSQNQTTTLTVESTLNTVPIGLILTLQPSINLETEEVTMNVRPTLSRITGTVNDPGVDIIVARSNLSTNVTSAIPEIEVRELDSILKTKSGEIMVIGGLMKEDSNNDDRGIPYLGRVPIVGNLFKSVVKTSQVTETIIFIKATIIPSQGYSEADKQIYQKFIRDPRPLKF